MQSYKDLDIYKISHRLAIEIHKMTLEELPKYEMFEEGLQVRKSSKSIPATIVEGYGRKTYPQEYFKFLTYALASCDETKEHLSILHESGSLIDKEKHDYLIKEYESLGRKLYRFRQVIQESM